MGVYPSYKQKNQTKPKSMEYMQSLTPRAKLIIIVISIFIVSMTVGLLAFGVNTDGGDIYVNSLHNVTSDMILVPHGESE